MQDLIELALYNPNEASDLMDRQFGRQWQTMDDKQLGELLTNHFSKNIDYADFATVTND